MATEKVKGTKSDSVVQGNGGEARVNPMHWQESWAKKTCLQIEKDEERKERDEESWKNE